MTWRRIYARPCPEVTDGGDVVVPGSGVVGEVQCRGLTVFEGYWKNPEASTTNFTAEAEEEDRWFRTGDLATLDARGYLSVVDRKTDMVLVGGENVYSAEVEAALHCHPAVKQAAVFGVDNEILGQMVHAAVVLRPGRSASPQELTAHARGLLSAYKVPAVLTVVESLPTSGTGKVIKTKLRAMAMAPKRRADATVSVNTGGQAAQEYAVVWRAIPPTAEWSAVSADSSAIVVIAPEPRGMLEPAVSTASEMARVTRSVLDRIGDELAGRETASVAVVSCPFVASSEAPGSPEMSASTPHAPLTGLLRGVIAEQRLLRTGGAVRQICVSASATCAGRVDDALHARLPLESEEPEVTVSGGDVLALRLERRTWRQMPQVDGADDGMHMASCLVVVESPGDIAPGGAAAVAIAFLASRPSCQSIAVWVPAMSSLRSRPPKAIDDVLSSAAAGGVQVTFSAVDMREDAQVARARQAAQWGDAISGKRAVDTVVCIRAPASDTSGDVYGSGSALGLTETELLHTYAQSVGLMNALDALKPAALLTFSPFTAADRAMTSPLWLASRALHDAVATVISQRHGTRVASVNIALPASAGLSAAQAAAEVSTAIASMTGDEGVTALQTIIRLSAGVSSFMAAASLGMASAAAAAAAAASLLPRAVASGHAPPQMTLQSSGPTLDDIQRRVYAAAATVLAQGPDSPPLEPSTSLWDLGMNSVNAVSLAAALEAEFRHSIPASIAFDYGTVEDLTGHIHSKYFAATVAAVPVVVAMAKAATVAAAGAAPQPALLPVTVTVMLTGRSRPLVPFSTQFQPSQPYFVALSARSHSVFSRVDIKWTLSAEPQPV